MPEFQEAASRTASVHVSGVSHVMLDAGSLGYADILVAWTGTLNLRIRMVPLQTHHLEFAARALHTSPSR